MDGIIEVMEECAEKIKQEYQTKAVIIIVVDSDGEYHRTEVVRKNELSIVGED